jgi:hypothetical protein
MQTVEIAMRVPIYQVDAFTRRRFAGNPETTLRAFQASPRGGEILCRVAGERVELEGACAFYPEEEIEI